MASVETLVSIKRGGARLPPGSVLHGLSRDEVDELHGFVREIESDEPEAAVVTIVQGDGSDDAGGGDDGAHAPPQGAEGAAEPQASPLEDVAAAIDLLDLADFTAAGRPKVGALTAVLGRKPSADEITMALALKAEQEG